MLITIDTVILDHKNRGMNLPFSLKFFQTN